MVIKPPGQPALPIRSVQESFVKLGIPPAHDSAVNTAAVELAQDLEQRRGRVYRLARNFMDGGSTLGMFNVSRVDQRLQVCALAFAIGLKNTSNFDDTMPFEIEASGLQIDKDELRHACFHLLG